MDQRRCNMGDSKEEISYIANRDLAIVFNTGAYGNFFNWTLNWMQGVYEQNSRPWGEYGNSHNYNKSTGYVKIHPANYNYTLDQFVKNLFNDYNFKKVLFIHPTENTMLWNLNNKFFKIWIEEGYIKNLYNSEDCQPRQDLSTWKKDFDSLDSWEIREYLSLSMMNAHLSEVRFNEIDKLSFDNFLKISLEEIASEDAFNNTLGKIVNFLSINVCRSQDEISQLYNEWLSLQEHINKDKLIKSYIHAIVNQIDIKFENLTIVDEAEIQRTLRDEYKLELKCYNLNTWPETTSELNKLLYKD